MSEWPELTDRIELEIPFGEDIRPGDAELDAFEAEFKLKLPDDYRLFMKTFGAGVISTLAECNFAAPGAPPIQPHDQRDLASFNRGARGTLQASYDMAKSSPYGKPKFEVDPAWLDRFIYFCVAGHGEDIFAWQADEVTNANTNDKNIYRITYFPKEPLVLVATTFREFVMDYLLSGRYFRDVCPANPDLAQDYRNPGSERLVYMQDIYGIDSD